MMYFGDVIKWLPDNLQGLTVNFYGNFIGRYIKNVKYFGDAIEYLPKNLQNLSIQIASN